MDNLTMDELKQLVNFYRQRSADLELQVLQLQMKLNKSSVEETVQATKTVADKTKK